MITMLRLRAASLLAAVLLLLWLPACASSPASSVNPADVEVVVTTDPSPALTNKAVRLAGQFSGIELDKSATVSFEIRSGDVSEYVDAVLTGDNSFAADYTFKRAGINEVFVHLYTGDIHVTKKRPIEVQ